MSGTFGDHGELDPSKSLIVSCIGKKRSGKSVMATMLFRSYPYDRIVIDVAGDDGPLGPDVVDLQGTVEDLPRRWPEEQRRDGQQQMTLRYVPDFASSTVREDMDAVVGLALSHGKRTGHCGLLVHEMTALAASNKTPPHTMRMLMQNRHNHVTLFAAGPRRVGMNPLVVAQSDLVYVFELPDQDDRHELAGDIGWPARDLDNAVHELGPHEYLRFDSNEQKPEQEGDRDLRLVHFDALPQDVVDETLRWARGGASDQESATVR